MSFQDELTRREYINACITKARLEAEWTWEESLRWQSPGAREALKRSEAAELLGVSVSTVRNLENSGQIRRMLGSTPRRVRYARRELEEYCKRQSGAKR